MKTFFGLLASAICLLSCGDDDIPDVSHIEVTVPVERFEQSFFAIDTINLAVSLENLGRKHSGFYGDFMRGFLGVSGNPDDSATLLVTREFIRGYLPIFDSISKKYSNISWLKEELENGFRFVKYYFPNYQAGKAITFIGPFDAAGTALTKAGIAIGLHQYAGKNFSVYQSTPGQQLFPLYISRRFDAEYITPNCMKAVVLDLFPDQSSGQPLIVQMIEKGKQWWLLDKFLPRAADSVKTGFTQTHLDFCERNEGLIWQTIITNEKNLYTTDPAAIQTYIGEAPYTMNMGENSPGNIGQWVGWQIVKKFVEKNPNLKVDEVMKMQAGKILEEAKYKPK